MNSEFLAFHSNANTNLIHAHFTTKHKQKDTKHNLEGLHKFMNVDPLTQTKNIFCKVKFSRSFNVHILEHVHLQLGNNGVVNPSISTSFLS